MAQIAVAGIDVFEYLRADAFQRRLLERAAERVLELQAQIRDDLAMRTINQLARSVKGVSG